MSRALFDQLPPADKVAVVARHHIAVVDFDPRADSRHRLASAVQASGRHHRHRQH